MTRGPGASAEDVERAAALVAGASRVVQRHLGEVLTYGAWMLLPRPWLLEPGPVARLTVQPLDVDDDEAALAACTEVDLPHHGPVDVSELATRSGPALAVRYRPVREQDGRRVVEEHRAVLWRRPGMVFALSLYATDLIEGGQAQEPFLELAASVALHVGRT